MKKLLVLIFAITIGVTLISCSGDSEEVVQSEEQVLSLEAISSSMLLSYNQESVEELAMPSQAMNGLADQEIEDLDYYVEMMEVFLGNENLQVETTESDKEEYETMVVYTTNTLNQEEITYTLYYNEFDLNDEETITEEATTDTETTEEATTEEATTDTDTTTEDTETTTGANGEMNKFVFDDEDDHLATKGIEGILIYGETTYNIEGKFINEDGKEIVRLRSYIDEGNFVVVNYQNDINGDKEHEKFFFKLVEEGITINQSKVRVFERENMTHIQLEMTEGESYSRYLFQIRERDGISYIHINYEIETPDTSEKGNIHLTKEIDPETGEAIYNYSVRPGNGGQEKSHSRRHGKPNNENTTRTTA